MGRIAIVLAAFLAIAVSAHAQLTMTGVGGAFGGGAAAYQGPGDVASGAAAWWGFRAYNVAYATGSNPAAIIDRLSDHTTQTINILNTGYFDAASAATFCAATTCVVNQLYDQTGNGNHLVWLGEGTAPAVTSSALNTFSCATFTASSNDELLTSGNFTRGQPLTAVYSAKRSNGSPSAYNTVLGDGTTNVQMGFNNASGTIFMYSGNAIPTTTATEGAMHAVQNIMHDATQSKFVVDGTVSNVTLGNTSGWAASPIRAGVGTGSFGGVVCEAGIWPIDMSSPTNFTTTLNTNMHAAYGSW